MIFESANKIFEKNYQKKIVKNIFINNFCVMQIIYIFAPAFSLIGKCPEFSTERWVSG